MEDAKARFLLDITCHVAFAVVSPIDETCRINVMRRVELGATQNLFFFYKYNFPDDDPDAKLTLRPNQGIAGLAIQRVSSLVGDRQSDYFYWMDYRTGNPVVKYEKGADYGLSADQRRMVRKLNLIYSFPIFSRQVDEGTGEARTDGEIIGAVNLDSQHPDAFRHHRDSGLMRHITNVLLPDLSLYAGVLMT